MILIGNKADLVGGLKQEAEKVRRKLARLPELSGRSDVAQRRRVERAAAHAALASFEYAAEMAEALRSFDGPSSEELLAKLKAHQDAALANLGERSK